MIDCHTVRGGRAAAREAATPVAERGGGGATRLAGDRRERVAQRALLAAEKGAAVAR